MGQVPQKNGLMIGDGKMARHWRHYLETQGLPLASWARSKAQPSPKGELSAYFSNFSTLFLGITDDSLEEFYETYLTTFTGTIFHFSGSYSHKRMIGLHPLMTFGENLYTAEFYEQIPLF